MTLCYTVREVKGHIVPRIIQKANRTAVPRIFAPEMRHSSVNRQKMQRHKCKNEKYEKRRVSSIYQNASKTGKIQEK
jgi:hypothetical protein